MGPRLRRVTWLALSPRAWWDWMCAGAVGRSERRLCVRLRAVLARCAGTVGRVGVACASARGAWVCGVQPSFVWVCVCDMSGG